MSDILRLNTVTGPLGQTYSLVIVSALGTLFSHLQLPGEQCFACGQLQRRATKGLMESLPRSDMGTFKRQSSVPSNSSTKSALFLAAHSAWILCHSLLHSSWDSELSKKKMTAGPAVKAKTCALWCVLVCIAICLLGETVRTKAEIKRVTRAAVPQLQKGYSNIQPHRF